MHSLPEMFLAQTQPNYYTNRLISNKSQAVNNQLRIGSTISFAFGSIDFGELRRFKFDEPKAELVR